jgi:hypothetical protein
VERSYDVGTRPVRGSIIRLTIATIVVLSMAATVAASNSNRFRTDLSGSNEVPPADPDGRGKATVRFEGNQVCFEVSFDRAGTANRGHIHRGAAGVNGPIVVAFFDLQDNAVSQFDPRHEELERRSRLSGCATVNDPALLAEIQANPAGFYVNLHNARFPGGMVRGQLGVAGGGDDDDD